MDSLAPVINWIKRNGFWLLSGLMSVAVLAGWYLASVQMQEAKTKSIREYQSSFSSVKNIKRVSAVTAEDGFTESVTAHPNADTAEKMTERLEATCDAVIAAWKMKRERQAPLMQFPKEVLGENTYRFFTTSKPPEQVANGEVVGREGETYLRTYGEQIPKKFALIARSIKANWKYDQERIDEEARRLAKEKEEMERNGMIGGMGSDRNFGMNNKVDLELNKFAVIWDERNQKLWQTKLTDFQNWDDNVKSSKSPTLLQAQMLQQDIWLLEGMFNIIKNVNGSATTNDLAVIKEIYHIAFGREARAKLGEVMEPDKRLGGAKVPAMNATGDDDMDYDIGGGRDGMMGESPVPIEGFFDINSDESPFHGRYVNVDLEPVPALEVINVVTGEEFPETNLELIVGKRVPFRLAVKMDERKINNFLSQCANSPFEFEVLQLRINRKETQQAPIEFNGGKAENKAATTIQGGMMEGMMDGMMDYGMYGGASGFQIQKLKALEPSEIETRLSYDVDVEFYGVVKLYNPVRGDYLRKAVGLPVEGNDGDENDAGELPSVAIREP